MNNESTPAVLGLSEGLGPNAQTHDRAADMLTAYAELIRRDGASRIEEHHYLPEVEAAAAMLREPPPARDLHRGGGSYEASMLRNLLARIHGDGGQYLEAHGLEKALDDAEAKVAMWSAALNEATTRELHAAQEADELRAVLVAIKAWDCEPAQCLSLPLDLRRRMLDVLGPNA